MNFKSGYAAILGLPNTGKSTLLNALLGQKISITTSKPQTTRKRILGILTGEDYQVIFLDTPGILNPAYLLQEKMMEHVNLSAKDADVHVFMIDIEADPHGETFFHQELVQQIVKYKNKPILLLLNKIDRSNQEKVTHTIERFDSLKKFDRILPISASLGANIGEVLKSIIEFLPEHPKYFPDDVVADETERFFVAEIIREKLFEQYQEEIPYSCDVLIADFKEQENRKDLIMAEIIVEKESQKGIIIGKQGAAIKKLGAKARGDIEKFLEREVFLDLRVKVRSKWRSDERILKSLGYSKDKE